MYFLRHLLLSSLLLFPRRRRPAWLDHLADELGAHLGARLALGKADIGKLGRVSDDAAVCVARDVGAPFPRCRVRMTRSDVLGLQALKFLLGAQLVGLGERSQRSWPWAGQNWEVRAAYHFDPIYHRESR